MAFVFTPPPQVALPVAGTDKLFPVNRVYCVGRNYVDHAYEMGGDPNKEPPFFFMKNPDALITDGEFPYPSESTNVHWELEYVFGLKSGGTNIYPEDAEKHVFGYAVGLDMTRRDLQNLAKKMGRPWETSKAIDKSGPMSALVPVETLGHPRKAAMWLDVNGERRQNSDISMMIWDVAHIISYASKFWELKAGDVFFTGTPAGVGACKRGDVMHCHIDGIPDLRITVA